eukprot:43329-Prorocentrum_minimum.AAC.1
MPSLEGSGQRQEFVNGLLGSSEELLKNGDAEAVLVSVKGLTSVANRRRPLQDRRRPLQLEDVDEEASEAAAVAKAQRDRAQMTSLAHASLDVLPPSGSMVDWVAETQAGV